MQHSVSNAHPAPRDAIPGRLVEVLYGTESKLSRHLLWRHPLVPRCGIMGAPKWPSFEVGASMGPNS